MFRSALNRIEAHSENTFMVGDRMDTDVVAGIEAGLVTNNPLRAADVLGARRVKPHSGRSAFSPRGVIDGNP